MKHRYLVLAPAVLLACAAVANAQYRDHRYDPDSVSGLIERVHVDLDRAYNAWHVSGGERGRLNHAENELRDFAKKWHRGRFDKGELDDAIAAVQHVLDNNHMNGREREALSEDVGQLRAMREAYDRHEIRERY